MTHRKMVHAVLRFPRFPWPYVEVADDRNRLAPPGSDSICVRIQSCERSQLSGEGTRTCHSSSTRG